jgi:hypothetical protein
MGCQDGLPAIEKRKRCMLNGGSFGSRLGMIGSCETSVLMRQY